MKQTILKIKVGEVFIDKKSYPVFQTAWKKTSRDGKTEYYEIRQPIFIQQIETKEKGNIEEEKLKEEVVM